MTRCAIDGSAIFEDEDGRLVCLAAGHTGRPEHVLSTIRRAWFAMDTAELDAALDRLEAMTPREGRADE